MNALPNDQTVDQRVYTSKSASNYKNGMNPKKGGINCYLVNFIVRLDKVL